MSTHQPWTVFIQTRSPVRVIVVVNHPAEFHVDCDRLHDEALQQLGCDSEDSRVLVIIRYPNVTTLAFDLFHEAYDPLTAHIVSDLPVIMIRRHANKSTVFLTSESTRQDINQQVAEQHDLHGYVDPPLTEDHQDGKIPVYNTPRKMEQQASAESLQ